MKLKFVISIMILIGCSPNEVVKEIQLVSESKLKEHHRTTRTEYSYDQNDSLYSERISMSSFDSKNRLINQNNTVFYEYNELGNIKEEKSIYRRDRIVRVDIIKYIYDNNQNIIHKIRMSEPLDTIETNIYNSQGQITQSEKGFETTIYEYNKDKLLKKTRIRKGVESRVSNFEYDSLGRLSIDNWIFSEKYKMKTIFKYDEKNRVIEEIDSSFNNTSPKSFVEFKTEYKYNEQDSITEVRNSGRILSEKEFKLRGKTIIKYK